MSTKAGLKQVSAKNKKKKRGKSNEASQQRKIRIQQE